MINNVQRNWTKIEKIDIRVSEIKKEIKDLSDSYDANEDRLNGWDTPATIKSHKEIIKVLRAQQEVLHKEISEIERG